MSDFFSNVNKIPNQIIVELPTDSNGLTSRECPSCESVFKIKFGTGLTEDNLPFHCPYCGHQGNVDEFHTKDQVKFAESIVMNKLMGALDKDLRKWGNDLERSTKNSLIQLKIDIKRQPQAIHYYMESELETFVTCEECTLEYSIYGVFAYCPDCGTHNSLQILDKNMELINKMMEFAEKSEDQELSEYLIMDGLENAISAFDGFGRAVCFAFSKKATNEDQAKSLSFQSISSARERVLSLFEVDFITTLSHQEWGTVKRCFQKRHLITHKLGVIDKDYIVKADDPTAVLGRKVTVSQNEVLELSILLKKISNELYYGLSKR